MINKSKRSKEKSSNRECHTYKLIKNKDSPLVRLQTNKLFTSREKNNKNKHKWKKGWKNKNNNTKTATTKPSLKEGRISIQ